jgi:hypothetical protein
MNLSKFLYLIGEFMDRKIKRSEKIAFIESLRVELIPVPLQEGKKQKQFYSVKSILSLMVSNLHRRGRPVKEVDCGQKAVVETT